MSWEKMLRSNIYLQRKQVKTPNPNSKRNYHYSKRNHYNSKRNHNNCKLIFLNYADADFK